MVIPAEFKSARQGEPVSTNKTAANTDAPPGVIDIVLIFHGIFSWGQWYSVLEKSVESTGRLKAKGIKYSTVYLPQFLMPRWVGRYFIPFYSRESAVQSVLENILEYPQDKYRVSVIAHSFGTWIIAEIMKRYPSVKFYKVVLVGCIVDDEYKWNQVIGRNVGPDCILNECGTRDVWPMLAQAISFGYGTTGVTGISAPFVIDRFQRATHSQLLTGKFCLENWVPFLEGKAVAVNRWSEVKTYSSLIKFLAMLRPLKWAISFLAIYFALFAFYAYFLLPYMPLPASVVDSRLDPVMKTETDFQPSNRAFARGIDASKTSMDKWRVYLGSGITQSIAPQNAPAPASMPESPPQNSSQTAPTEHLRFAWFEEEISPYRVSNFNYLIQHNHPDISVVECYAFLVSNAERSVYSPEYRQLRTKTIDNFQEIIMEGVQPKDRLLCFLIAKRIGTPLDTDPQSWGTFLTRR